MSPTLIGITERRFRGHDVVGMPRSLWSLSYSTVTERADDGTVEAIEVTGHRSIGVPWHHERLAVTDLLFEWLVAQTRQPAKEVALT